MDEIMAYMAFGEAERICLQGLHDKLAPHFAAIAERFYAAVFAAPGAAAVLTGPAQVERLRVTLIDWMSTGLRGPYDTAFYEKRSRIGRRHVQIGLAQQYMFTAMDVVRIAYHEHIAQLYAADDALLVVRAVDKLFDLELALMLRHYQLDSEEKLLARERAMQSDRVLAMQTMTAGLAHEVRNPLNAAKLQLELLERRLKKQQGDDPRIVEPIELAHFEMSRLTNLLNDFLAFARAPELHASECDVVAIAKQVLELERPLAERAQIELAFAPAAPAIAARVDAGKLHQVLQNLVRNAIEATPKGGRVTVEVAMREDRALELRVVDDGPGIPEEVRRRIFEPFFSTKETGTGLGMSIAHSFVAMHGGSIELLPGKPGTTIVVTLPQ